MPNAFAHHLPNLRHFLIWSDFLSAIHSLLAHLTSQQTFCQMCHIYKRGCCVVFCWVPGHAGLLGYQFCCKSSYWQSYIIQPSCDNKTSLSTFTVLYTPHGRMSGVTHMTTSCEMWNLQFKCGSLPLGPFRRKNLLSHLHIGHTYLMHWHLLHDELPPSCSQCDTLTVQHILIGCPSYNDSHHALQLRGLIQDIFWDDYSNVCKVSFSEWNWTHEINII